MKEIEIPFGANNSELKGWEYTIPEGMEAEIKDGKIVVREKESEDEMIRKRLINLIKELATSKVPILTGGYFVDGQDKKYIAWLEKQKENPKSADSIPSDCVSDAKCENSWHKVGDSLPDNPREVLCKDEAGNYFIGRYYTSEGWEISNYDDEDKPHHLNPPVSKWIDFPSEKQKDFPTTDKEMLEFLATHKQVDVPEKYKTSDWLFEKQKEQKPAEWSEEDEQLLGFIYDLLADSLWNSKYAMSRDECLDRLTSLRQRLQPHPSWKPSEEQMRALNAVIKHLLVETPERHRLEEIYEQLKKLI